MTYTAPPRRAASNGRYERDADGHPTSASLDKGDPTPERGDPLIGRTADGSEAGVIAAFLVDMSLHLAIGATVWHLAPGPTAVGFGLLAWLSASFLHRVVVQRFTRTTIGKCSFGLRLRHPDGTYPTTWRLIVQWFQSGWSCFDIFGGLN
ncbi:RDD family protein [Nocardia rhizosphaerae]|uniref:RDD family protein n=1 Tax=Nocardia rhizosphaerae TaxID=1691571 RepID=A0ABV8L6C7_9NOCA